MYAKFQDEQTAQDFTDAIHKYLCDNRPGYAAQTTIWSPVIKHDTEELWAVPLPPEAIPGDYFVIDNLDGWVKVLDKTIR